MAQAKIELSVVGAEGVRSATQEIKSFGKATEEAGGALRSFAGGAGLSKFSSLIIPTSIAAFAAAVGGILAQSFKVAMEFERISQRTVFTLSQGSDSLLANINAFKAAAMSPQMQALGLGPLDAARMMSAYGMSAGATLQQTIANAPSVARWARAYGLDPTQYAQQMGLVSQYTGGNVDRDSAAFFGGAAVSGQAGRRPVELLAYAANQLSQIAQSNPFDPANMRDAMREVAGVASLGGYYATSAGLNTTLGAFNALGGPSAQNPIMAGLALRSGWSLLDVYNGTTDPGKINALAEQIQKQSGGSQLVASMLLSNVLSPDQRRVFTSAMQKNGGNFLAAFSDANAAPRVGAYGASDNGKWEQTLAKLQDTEMKIGETEKNLVVPALNALAQHLDILSGVMAASMVGGGLKNVLGIAKLLRGGAAAAEAAEGGATAAEAIVATGGGGALMSLLGLGGAVLAPAALGIGMFHDLFKVTSGLQYSHFSAFASAAGMPHAVQIAEAAKKYGISPMLLASLGQQESGLRNIVGDHGHGHGIFQFDDRWNDAATIRAAMDPSMAAMLAAKKLRGLIDYYHGDVGAALDAYNEGQAGYAKYGPGGTTKTHWDGYGDVNYDQSVALQAGYLKKTYHLDDGTAVDITVRKPTKRTGSQSRSNAYRKH